MDTIKKSDAALLIIGNEILSGKSLDTNSQFIANKLGELGISILKTIIVQDDERAIKEAVGEAVKVSNLVISTGGLGPTRDDITKKTVAEYFSIPIVVDEGQLEIVREKFKKLGYSQMPGSNISQAQVPEGSEIFPNTRGTAPGLLIKNDDVRFFMLPGVPAEMRGLMTEHVIPYIKEHLSEDLQIVSRTLRTIGIGESLLAEKIDHLFDKDNKLEIAYLPKDFRVDIRLTARGKNPEKLAASIKQTEQEIIGHISEHIYAFDDESLEAVIGNQLKKRNMTLATAESCTGGLIAQKITAIPGSSVYFTQGAVTYSNESKVRLLGVDPAILEEKGAVSEEVAAQMAEGIRKTSGSDIGVSVTGIAGPDGGTPKKPVGLVFIGLSDRHGTIVDKLHIKHNLERNRIRNHAAVVALDMLRLRLHDKNLYSD